MLFRNLLAGLTLVLIAMPCLAQFPKDTYGGGSTKADATFSLCDRCIKHRHTAMLGNGTTLTVELYQHDGYKLIPDLEQLLTSLTQEIAFVSDSVRDCPQCSFRLDYLISPNGMKSYRLRSRRTEGTFLYQKNVGDDMKPFKPEPDTLHLLVKKLIGPTGIADVCQVTLTLNRLANLDSLLAKKGKLNHVIDTMRQTSAPKHMAAKKRSWNYSTTLNMFRSYRDTSLTMIYFRRGITHEGEADFSTHTAFDAQVNFGAGFLRDRFAPVAEGGLVYRLPGTRGDNLGELLLGLYGSGYFAFAKAEDGSFNMQDNWFLNAEFGGESGDNETGFYGITFRRISVGVGYLVSRKGEYFQGSTGKLFMNFRLKNGVTLSPEIIATDNFHQVFPGLTVKIF